MLTSILQLFENDVVTAIIQSIGIIYVKTTAPNFSLASQYKSALEMTTIYNTLVKELEKIVKKPALLLDTSYIMFPGYTTQISQFNMAVLKPLVAYSTVIESLEQMALSINKCKKKIINYLPGGKYYCQSEKKIKESFSCPSNNIAFERMMRQLDRQKTISTNISLTTINTKLMMKNNKTMEWLGEKYEEDKGKIVAQYRKDAEILKEKSIAEEIEIEQERRETLKQRIEEKGAKLKKI
ncbi:unnamed protein product [Mytilus coruscus]|uniref:Uncharacterized protein n=1 Tax=Mytilus coruscus TaxID=42192 RepID=A0A6J8A569_MYTCO|nr:unnamed protein product [Mytilus coruscus]